MSHIIHFNEGDVEVCKLTNTKFAAWEVGKAYQAGYGSTMLEAIVDLNEKLKEER